MAVVPDRDRHPFGARIRAYLELPELRLARRDALRGRLDAVLAKHEAAATMMMSRDVPTPGSSTLPWITCPLAS